MYSALCHVQFEAEIAAKRWINQLINQKLLGEAQFQQLKGEKRYDKWSFSLLISLDIHFYL